MTFEDNLAFGKIGESEIAEWLKSRGHSVLPVYEKEIIEGKGPQFFGSRGNFAAPDLFIFPGCIWIEAKHKTVFSWYRVDQKWETGIDLNHYEDYKKVRHLSGRPVFLVFLHRSEIPDHRDLKKGSPSKCPTGIFVGNLDKLIGCESHRSNRHGWHGMVYWREEVLTKINTTPLDVNKGTADEMLDAYNNRNPYIK